MRLIKSILFILIVSFVAAQGKWAVVGTEKMAVNGRVVVLTVKINECLSGADCGEEKKSFFKINDDKSVMIDSVVYSDGSSYVKEHNEIQNIIREKYRTGVVWYTIFKNSTIVDVFCIGETNLYENDGSLKVEYREVRGDTAFLNLDYGGGDWGSSFHGLD